MAQVPHSIPQAYTLPPLPVSQTTPQQPNITYTSPSKLHSPNSPSQQQQQQPSSEQPETKEKPVKRVYPQYHWRSVSPSTRLVYLRDPVQAESELQRLVPGPVGFDMEWKPNYVKGRSQNPVALIQLATHDVILLIQVSAMRVIPGKLREILQDHRYMKAGAGIQGDAKKLWEDWGVPLYNVVDLSLLARSVDNARWKGRYINPIGLARMCETYLDLTLDKGRITRSNWEAFLSEPQQAYAANDSHSGLMLLLHMMKLGEKITPPLKPHYYSFDHINGYNYELIPSSSPGSSQEALPLHKRKLWQPSNPNYDPGPVVVKDPDWKAKKQAKSDERKRRRALLGNGAGKVNSGSDCEVGSSSSPRRRRSSSGSCSSTKGSDTVRPSRSSSVPDVTSVSQERQQQPQSFSSSQLLHQASTQSPSNAGASSLTPRGSGKPYFGHRGYGRAPAPGSHIAPTNTLQHIPNPTTNPPQTVQQNHQPNQGNNHHRSRRRRGKGTAARTPPAAGAP